MLDSDSQNEFESGNSELNANEVVHANHPSNNLHPHTTGDFNIINQDETENRGKFIDFINYKLD